LHLRDVRRGRGQCHLAYAFLHILSLYYPDTAAEILFHFCNQIGSWKDIKRLCQYLYTETPEKDNHPLVAVAIRIMNRQLRWDEENTPPSLASKWVPREHSAQSWLFERLAKDYFSPFLQTARTPSSFQKAVTKCKTWYRRLCVRLQKNKPPTLESLQCARQWSHIDPHMLTSAQWTRQVAALLNVDHQGQPRDFSDEDRLQCSQRCRLFIDDPTTLPYKRWSLSQWARMATQLLEKQRNQIPCETECRLLQKGFPTIPCLPVVVVPVLDMYADMTTQTWACSLASHHIWVYSRFMDKMEKVDMTHGTLLEKLDRLHHIRQQQNTIPRLTSPQELKRLWRDMEKPETPFFFNVPFLRCGYTNHHGQMI
jgi:hypothetical protein